MKNDHLDGKLLSDQWLLLERAASADEQMAGEAISEICKWYWAPLYVFARGRGMGGEDAVGMVQIVFEGLLDKDLIKRVDVVRGRLRTFFRTVVDRVVLMRESGDCAQEGGGGQVKLSFDQGREEEWLGGELLETVTAESLFDKRWALSVLEQSLLKMRAGYVKKGKGEVFDVLKPYLGWSMGEDSYGEVAQRLRLSEGAVKVAVHRLRQTYKEILQRQVADTIGSSDAELIKEEITHLFTALS
ncbi:MAG: RNA polymerase sigma factor [Akkermansiaceae bacterium]